MTTTNDIVLRPAMSYAFLKVLPLILLALLFLLPALFLSPFFLLFSFPVLGLAWYRLLFIRSSAYLINAEIIRVSRGIFFKRTDHLEMYRIKDYIITQPFTLQLLHLMNLTLKSTDPENPVLRLQGIPESDIVETIREHVQEARKGNNIYEIN